LHSQPYSIQMRSYCYFNPIRSTRNVNNVRRNYEKANSTDSYSRPRQFRNAGSATNAQPRRRAKLASVPPARCRRTVGDISWKFGWFDRLVRPVRHSEVGKEEKKEEVLRRKLSKPVQPEFTGFERQRAQHAKIAITYKLKLKMRASRPERGRTCAFISLVRRDGIPSRRESHRACAGHARP
jgi:hypothetical protein